MNPRGRLKISLGYASGVGKSHRMFEEAKRRQRRGQDVVIASMHGANETMDLDAILQRHPQVCLVDGLAYDNPPGSRHPKRWMDVDELLNQGISVIASINLQFVEEYRERVQAITGKVVTTTVPVAFIHSADEIEVVDAPPEFCIRRAEQLGDPTLRRFCAGLPRSARSTSSPIPTCPGRIAPNVGRTAWFCSTVGLMCTPP